MLEFLSMSALLAPISNFLGQEIAEMRTVPEENRTVLMRQRFEAFDTARKGLLALAGTDEEKLIEQRLVTAASLERDDSVELALVPKGAARPITELILKLRDLAALGELGFNKRTPIMEILDQRLMAMFDGSSVEVKKLIRSTAKQYSQVVSEIDNVNPVTATFETLPRRDFEVLRDKYLSNVYTSIGARGKMGADQVLLLNTLCQILEQGIE